MYKLGLKRNLISLGFTVLIITMLLFSGPAKAIDVSLTTYDIDISTDSIKTFTLQVQINDGEFLPIWKTDIEFDNDGEIITCQIDSNNQVTGCDFLSVVSQDITNLDYGYGYGYGYDYGYGYQDFGYGYGYGYGTRGAIGGASYGVITYTLLINVAELPDSFTGNTIDATATVYGGNENDFESFKGSSSFDVTNNDQELVDNAKTSLTFNSIKGDNTNENQITENLNLVTINSDGVKISWASSDTSINTYNGQVTRPGYNEVNKEVTLTATLSKGTKSDTKEFILTVLKESKTDVDSVAQAKLDLTYDSILNGQDKDTVTTNLDLITEGSDGTTISWSSDNENTIGTDGSVSRAQLDKKVILTASISKNDASDTKEFSVIVIGTEDENELAVAQAKLDLTESLILNGNSAKDKIMGSLKLPTSLANHEDVSISWSSSNTAIVANDGSITRSNDEDKEITLTATLTKNSKSTTKVFSLIIKKNVAPPVLDDGKAEVNDGESEILIDNTNANDIKEINIPSSVDENELVSLNLNSLVNQSTNTVTLGSNDLKLSRATTSMEYKVEIPSGTEIKGNSDWNGLITLPTLKATSEVSISEGAPEIVIEVGSSKIKLVFDKATKITIPGQTGKSAGYVNIDGDFVTIPACTAAQIANPDTLPAEGDCYTTEGSDLIIWTKHFTKFVSYTPTVSTTSPGSDDAGGAGPSPKTGTGLIERLSLTETPTTEEEIISEGEVTTTEGMGGITGAVVGTNKTGIYLGIIAIIFVVIVGIWQGGNYIRKNKGIYF